MIQSIEKILAYAADKGLLATDIVFKNALLCVIRIAPTAIKEQGLTDKVIHRNFKRMTWSEILVNICSEEVCIHPIVT